MICYIPMYEIHTQRFVLFRFVPIHIFVGRNLFVSRQICAPAKVFTRYTDSAFPSNSPVDESLRFSLRYEVGAFYGHLRELEAAVEEKNLPGGVQIHRPMFHDAWCTDVHNPQKDHCHDNGWCFLTCQPAPFLFLNRPGIIIYTYIYNRYVISL